MTLNLDQDSPQYASPPSTLLDLDSAPGSLGRTFPAGTMIPSASRKRILTATGLQRGMIVFSSWDAATGQELYRSAEFPGQFMQMALMPQNSYVVLACTDRVLLIPVASP